MNNSRAHAQKDTYKINLNHFCTFEGKIQKIYLFHFQFIQFSLKKTMVHINKNVAS